MMGTYPVPALHGLAISVNVIVIHTRATLERQICLTQQRLPQIIHAMEKMRELGRKLLFGKLVRWCRVYRDVMLAVRC